MKKFVRNFATGLVCVITLGSCASTIPEGVTAVSPFEKNRYLGHWYEIARIDFKHERNMNNTTANYSINKDGTIKVVNKGFDYVKKEWKQAEGKAKFVGNDTIAMLKVSFFRPFYSGYNVIAIDENYNYALVSGKSTKYLWILSRFTTIPDDIKNFYLETAANKGFDTSSLVWVEHN